MNPDELAHARQMLLRLSEEEGHQCFRLKPEIDPKRSYYEGWIMEVKATTISFAPAPSPFDEEPFDVFATVEMDIAAIDLSSLLW